MMERNFKISIQDSNQETLYELSVDDPTIIQIDDGPGETGIEQKEQESIYIFIPYSESIQSILFQGQNEKYLQEQQRINISERIKELN